MSNQNAPIDVTAEQAKRVVEAAISWRWKLEYNPVMTECEWRLYEATSQYGENYKGLRGR